MLVLKPAVVFAVHTRTRTHTQLLTTGSEQLFTNAFFPEMTLAVGRQKHPVFPDNVKAQNYVAVEINVQKGFGILKSPGYEMDRGYLQEAALRHFCRKLVWCCNADIEIEVCYIG